MPNIGHAEAKHAHDLINNRWLDKRLVSMLIDRNNNQIFLAAAERMFEKLRRHYYPYREEYTQQEKTVLLDDLSKIMSLSDPEERIQNYRELGREKRIWRREIRSL